MALQPLPFQSFHSLQGSPYFALFASLTLSPPAQCYMSLRINLKNILGQAKRQSRYRTSSFMSLRINLKNIPHEEVFRVCTIIGIFFDSCIAERDKQIDMRCCLSGASSSNDYDNITYGLGAQDVFEIILKDIPQRQSNHTNWHGICRFYGK